MSSLHAPCSALRRGATSSGGFLGADGLAQHVLAGAPHEVFVKFFVAVHLHELFKDGERLVVGMSLFTFERVEEEE